MSPDSESLPKQAPALRAPRPKIDALTSARFFAALYVVLGHTKWGVPAGSGLFQFLTVAYSSVSFFFLLSGYILGVVYLREGKPVAPRNFYVARFARIYPFYIVSVLMDTPFAVAARVAKYGLLVACKRVLVLLTGSTFMLQMWLPVLTVINIPSWSLSVEAVFYISFPFLGPVLWKLRKRGLMLAGLTLYIFSLSLHWVILQHWPDPVAGLDLASYTALFAIGILVSRWQTLHQEEGKRSRVGDTSAWIIFALTSLTFVASAAYASPWLTQKGIQFGLLCAPVFVAWIWLLSSAHILPVRWLGARWLVVLGEASYGLYLIHVPILHILRKLGLEGVPRDYPLYLGLCIGLSILSFYFFETPTRRWILHRFRGHTKETMKAASAAQ
jgi:peptidoglycan/LPS O-acetylase OafA/YrhL